MTDFVELPSGLLVPASAQGGGQGASGGEPASSVKASGTFNPSVPPGFERDMEAYNARMGKELRPNFSSKYGVWRIQAKTADGQWMNILVVNDWDKATEEDPWHYRPLDQRVFTDLYAADLAYRFGTGNPDMDLEMYDIAMREARAIAEERAEQDRATMFNDIERDAKRINERIAAFMKGEVADLVTTYQVPASAPLGGE